MTEPHHGPWDLAEIGESRRDFLKLMGFSIGAAALAGCTRIPERQAVPLLSQPEGELPGVASWYATTCGGCPSGCGLLVKTRDGRPIKIDGNPRCGLSSGATCAAGQGTVLSLYDGQRLRGPRLHGRPASWTQADAFVMPRLAAIASRGGRIAILTETITSPSIRKLIEDFTRRFPSAFHVVHDPVSLAALRKANGESFGRPVVPRFRFDQARVIVGLEADFLGTWLSPVEFTRAYTRGRRPDADMSRHYQFESGLSLTGSNADRRAAVLPSEIGLVALALAGRLGASVPTVPPPCSPALLDAVADDLRRHRGESLVVCGVNDPAVQGVVNRINSLLGNLGRTIDLDRPSFQRQGDDGSVLALIEAMERGEIHGLLLWGVNPAYDHPEAERFVRALSNVALRVSFADRLDETAVHADAVCPDHHFLESWGDAEPVAGSFRLRQPSIAPLFDTRSFHESLLRWMGEPPDVLTHLREVWRRDMFPRQKQWNGFDDFWDHALQEGGFETEETAILPGSLGSLTDRGDLAACAAAILSDHKAAEGLQVRLYEKAGLRDGRHANNPWLQELPDPITRVTWGNYVTVAPALASERGLEEGDVVILKGPGKAVELPVHVQPGQPRQAVSIALGYGRTRAGKVGDGVGANAFPLLAVSRGFSRGWAAGFQIEKTGRSEVLAATQLHDSMEGRPIVREANLSDFLRDPTTGNEERPHPETLWAEHPREGHFWGMAIDLNACTGCGACVVACQAENNVAVVGRDEVARSREMHWIRIDRYYSGPEDEPRTAYQPMMCQHCGNAPCESVCPVLATVHSSDGLNQQVYNRCVGTRYCANNCPYKVRRFNWFQYANNERFDYTMNGELERMVLNPDVVVRSRGVMEKCSLCIQRVQAGKLKAETAGVPLADGDIKTACQQACPAEAIVFGDLNDPASAVSRQQASPRFYRVLEELNTRPVVGYLARVRNTGEKI
ncbi:MAG TPA: 4Fe-4S dicluster domain-containing protein [Thermoanaerobaculia bacterium]|jgi:molybdopterin-containing oxidoreductase family iron-sulfur binding subunit|nr:4Fe-4S dicluster domain-containing protein [Thermoanaerobaculia bacterium]